MPYLHQDFHRLLVLQYQEPVKWIVGSGDPVSFRSEARGDDLSFCLHDASDTVWEILLLLGGTVDVPMPEGSTKGRIVSEPIYFLLFVAQHVESAASWSEFRYILSNYIFWTTNGNSLDSDAKISRMSAFCQNTSLTRFLRVIMS